MKDGMTIEYLKCLADLSFEVHFRVNDVIGTIATKCDLILFRKWIVFINYIIIFKNLINMSLKNNKRKI